MHMTFIDTSILCNLVPVPGFDQHRDQVVAEMDERIEAGETFILPITSVIETGNHIAQLKWGDARRKAAETFDGILRFVYADRAPWVLHDVAWNREFLQRMLDGADTTTSYLDHAVSGLGAGDLCILTERHAYVERSRIPTSIWTLDVKLSAHV